MFIRLATAVACVFAIAAITQIASAASTSAASYLTKPDDWYRSDEAARIAASILSFQASSGGWPKNIDTATQPYTGDTSALHATYDNKATTDEARYIALMYVATKDAKYRDSFIHALDYVLSGQYANGGWPQSNLPGKGYDRYITYNDSAMGRLMFFVKQVGSDKLYDFVDDARRAKCRDAFDRGVDCILKCQIKVNGKLTAWCAQHDEKDFSPRPARTFELVSLSGAESVGIIHVLMSVEKPTPEIIAAVDAAVAWLDSVKLKGIRVEDRPNKDSPKGFDRFVIDDPAAPPMWARFYEIGTNQPIFSGRDGVMHHKLSEIEPERRNGYKWLGYFPANLITTEYPAWKSAHTAHATN